MSIKVQRTEYTIGEILDSVEKDSGEPSTHSVSVKVEQLDMFDLLDDEEVVEIRPTLNEKSECGPSIPGKMYYI
ncbi:hypothetical protein [Oceanobacillus saliphilus]|uniref:hypothetical protein n=1 Tax=Oceanobacillus saliphilus TaxID=2925834 RepID=UPI00201E29EE|nr:hypothetical protein [Oceanobacillus saliphilus]